MRGLYLKKFASCHQIHSKEWSTVPARWTPLAGTSCARSAIQIGATIHDPRHGLSASKKRIQCVINTMGARSRPVARTTSSGDITRGRNLVDSGACVSSRPTTGSKKVFWKTRRCAVCHWRKDCKTEKEAKEYWKKGGTCKGKKCRQLRAARCLLKCFCKV